jgi:hypothetical protein
MRGEYEFERIVRLCTERLFTVDGKNLFPRISQDGVITAQYVCYVVGDTHDVSAKSIDEDCELGLAVKDFAEMRTSCAHFTPYMSREAAKAELERAIKALAA